MVLVRPMPSIRPGPYMPDYVVYDTKTRSSSKPDEQILSFHSKALSRSNQIAFSPTNRSLSGRRRLDWPRALSRPINHFRRRQRMAEYLCDFIVVVILGIIRQFAHLNLLIGCPDGERKALSQYEVIKMDLW